MASSNAPSGSKAPHLPDLGLATQSAAPLRKPHSATTSKSSLDTVISATQSLTISSDSSNTQASTLQSKSILSPNAKEFVPKSYQQPVVQQQHQHQHQQQQPSTGGGRHHHHKSYNDTTNGTSRRDNWAVAEANYPPDTDSEFDDYYALAYLSDFTAQVSIAPHMYDEEILNLTEVLNSCIDEDEDIVLPCIVNNIVDTAIIDPNFRYSGVRLCEHLIRHLTVSGGTTKVSFKQELLSRCQREHSRRKEMMKARDQGLYLRGFTLFVADLSTKLTNEEVLLTALPDLMETLLSEPSADNVKTVVLALKVSKVTFVTIYLKTKDLSGDINQLIMLLTCFFSLAFSCSCVANHLNLQERDNLTRSFPS